MDKKEIIEKLKKEAIRTTINNSKFGGQHCGVISRGITLIHEELGFSVTINNYRTQLKNIELAYILFELYLEEVIKE